MPPTPTAPATRTVPRAAWGDLASFSFQSSKNLTSGEGGLVTTNNDELAAACRSLHNCGRIPTGVWYEHHVISGNYRLGELQGALLNAQLDRLEEQTSTRDATDGIWRSSSKICRAFILSSVPKTVPGTRTICSCCGSTPSSSACRAPR